MKTVVISFSLLASLSALTSTNQGIVCRDDRRMNNGSLREIFLTPSVDGYFLQSQYAASLNNPEIITENWAQKLTCRIDDKSTLAFCQNTDGYSATIKERREVFYDSLDEDAKKKAVRFTDISVYENGSIKKTLSFTGNMCKNVGGEN